MYKKKYWLWTLIALSCLVLMVQLSFDFSSSSTKRSQSSTVSFIAPKHASGTPQQETLSQANTSVIKPSKPSGNRKKTVYLTFDDGPSKLTPKVLNLLKKKQIPATFFVLGQQVSGSPEVIRRIVEEGHSIGNHTYNHNYKEVYVNFSAFWSQIKQTEELVRNITGSRPQLVRAPGGTYGHFDATFFKLLDQAGYKVFDWNVDSGDSRRKGVPASEILKSVKKQPLKENMVVLMHDGAGHEETLKALPQIIAYYQSKGYAFARLTPEVKPVQFHVGGHLPKSRVSPSKDWIESHITPNRALFQKGQSLNITAGRIETRLEWGEYKVEEGKYIVPVRVVMERLGAKVTWDAEVKKVQVLWGNRKFSLGLEGAEYLNDSVWLPLRTLLDTAGMNIVLIHNNTQEHRVKATY